VRRGYRQGTGPAPIKETLAAGILALSGWTPEQTFFDPMCGSGTFAIEAALIAGQIAPGLLRRGRFAFENWSDHDRPAFLRVMDELRDAWRPIETPIFGFDTSNRVLDAARANAKRARIGGAIEFRKARFERVQPPAESGLIVTNPPYGQRLDADPQLYRDLGDALKAGYGGWTAWIIAATAPLKGLGLRPARRIPLRNGPIDCRLVCVPITARRPAPEDAPAQTAASDTPAANPADASAVLTATPVDPPATTAVDPPATKPADAPTDT
jgi:putative N6-adenine-specific DNA methylase